MKPIRRASSIDATARARPRPIVRNAGRTHSRFISHTPSPSGVTPTQPASLVVDRGDDERAAAVEEPTREVVPVGDVREDQLEVRVFAGPGSFFGGRDDVLAHERLSERDIVRRVGERERRASPHPSSSPSRL